MQTVKIKIMNLINGNCKQLYAREMELITVIMWKSI